MASQTSSLINQGFKYVFYMFVNNLEYMLVDLISLSHFLSHQIGYFFFLPIVRSTPSAPKAYIFFYIN